MTIQYNCLKDAATNIKFSAAGRQIQATNPLLCARWWHRRLTWVYTLGLAAMAWTLVGCTPGHNWREVRHEGVPGSALLPCKPDRAVRDVAMLGPDKPAAPLHMMSCDVQGRTFAWAAWPLEGAHQGHEVIQAWQKAGWASLRQPVAAGEEAPEGWSMQTVNQTGALMAVRWQGPGVNHQAVPIDAHWLMLYTAEWAMQLAVYGPAASPELLELFWTEVKLPLANPS